jgi:hypothetical protein
LIGQPLWWQGPFDVMKILRRQTELLEMIRALRPPRCLPRRLDGRQEQGHEYSDNRNDNQ